MNLSQAIDKAFGSLPRVYISQALSGIFRYWVSNPANPLILNGVKVTSNSPTLVSPSGVVAAGICNCASPTDVKCVQSYNFRERSNARRGGQRSVEPV